MPGHSDEQTRGAGCRDTVMNMVDGSALMEPTLGRVRPVDVSAKKQMRHFQMVREAVGSAGDGLEM